MKVSACCGRTIRKTSEHPLQGCFQGRFPNHPPCRSPRAVPSRAPVRRCRRGNQASTGSRRLRTGCWPSLLRAGSHPSRASHWERGIFPRKTPTASLALERNRRALRKGWSPGRLPRPASRSLQSERWSQTGKMKRSKLRGSGLRRTLSDFTAKEKECRVEAEFSRLQKQFRISAEKRKCFGANVRQQIHAQEKEIESLKEEHRGMSLTLSQISSLRNVMQDDRNRMELKCLLQTKDQYDCLIRDRKALLAEQDSQILELQKKIVRQNLIATKVKQANSSKWLQNQIQTLEMRLNNVTVRFDTILAANNKLREEIENLRIQKAILDNFYAKLRKHLDQQKSRMDAAVEQSTQAYEQRVEALARISAMSERHSKDTVQYNVELQERERIRHQENKLKTFVLAKFTDRSELEEEAKKKEALKAARKAKRRQGESFESREVAYKRLLELAENGDIDQLANGFIEKEGKNFAYFSYATELNNETEKLQQRIKDLQNETMLFTTDQDNAESSSLHVLKELEEKLSQTTEKANEYEERCKESSKVLGRLKSAMEVLFKEIDCDAMKIKEQLGDNGQITDLNLMQFFALVEKKTNELLLKESVLLYLEADGSLTSQTFTNPLLGGTELLRGTDLPRFCPQPPAPEGAADATDAFEAPLDHARLRELALQSCERERGSAGSTGKKGRNDI